MEKQYRSCRLCPRLCGVDRSQREGRRGSCGMGDLPVVARAAVHYWEEPCISGTRGSGTIFFSGCSLKCVYCQNHAVSWERFGKEISVSRLGEIFLELEEKGVHNINLVNPTHFVPSIVEALEAVPLTVPVVYNSSGYERVETLKQLEGKISVYLPDCKYSDNRLALRYSQASDYFETAQRAIEEMYRQTGPAVMDEEGILQRGVLLRHLLLPHFLKNTYGVLDWIAERFPKGEILVSLMSQYTPCGDLEKTPELKRKITYREREKAVEYMQKKGILTGYVQELDAAEELYIPPFDLEGV